MKGNKKTKRNIVIPVVGFAREFDGKLLLALVARERGHQAFVGAKPALNNKTSLLSPMLYVAKNAYTNAVELFAQLHREGNKIAVLDEESLVRQSDEIYLMKHHQDALQNVGLLMSWGASDQSLWRSSSMLEDTPAVAVGNPRVDMLRPALRSYFDSELTTITGRFGDYVLLNTNFPIVNNYLTHGESFALAETTERAADEKQNFLNYKRLVFDRFKEIILPLSKAIFPSNLVIRPHPSELQEPWLQAAKGLSNVHVICEGSVVPWLIGARALIHNGCTSAIEYALLDKIALSYGLEKSAKYEDSLANKLSLSCSSKETLIRSLISSLNTAQLQPSSEQRQLLKRHIESGSSRLCCELMLDAFESFNLTSRKNTGALGLELAMLWRAGKASIEMLRHSMASQPRKHGKKEYRRHMFPNIDTQYVDERIRRFQQCLGRFHGFKSKQIAPRAFEIV